MIYSYSNNPPSQVEFESLYSDSEMYLVNETLPDLVMTNSDRKTWVRSQLADCSVHTQIIKDEKIICWFAGEAEDNLANYKVALVSSDKNGSRSFWYDTGFWQAVESVLKINGFAGWMCYTVSGTSLHSTLISPVEGKKQLTENFINITNVDFVKLKYLFAQLEGN